MGDNTLAVKITADTADLQAKFATAKAEVSALTQEMNKLARQSAAGVLDPAGMAQLQDVAHQFLEAKAAARELSEELKGTTAESFNLGEGLQGIRSQIGTAFEVTGIAAAYEGVKKLVEVIGEYGERAIQLRSTSEILNLTIEQVQALQHAAEEAGVGEEVLTRAGEKLTIMLNDAREDSGAAVEKLKALGVSTDDIKDPTFQLIDLLKILHGRLTDTNTEEQTRNELMKDLGSRTALAVVALKEFDGTQAGVAVTMAKINGLTKENAEAAASAKAATHSWVSAAENEFTKLLFGERAANASLHELITGMSELSSKSQSIGSQGLSDALTGKKADPNADAEARVEARQKSVNAEIAAIQVVSLADVKSAKDAIAAFKQGTAERLAAVKKYAEEAAVFYGADSIDKVREANKEKLTEERAYNDAQGTLREESIRAEIKANDGEVKARLAGIRLSVDANEQYFSNAVQVHDAIESMEQTGLALQTKIYSERAKTAAQLTKLTEKETREQLAEWQYLTNGMQQGFASAMRGMLSGTESFGQAMRGIFSSVFDAIIGKLAEWAAEWITEHLLALATTKTTAVGEVTTAAGIAGANAMASVAAIPFVGWAMAPEVGATTYAETLAIGLPKMDVGAWNVPRDMVAQIHKGETIVPANFAEGMRKNGGFGEIGGGARPVHIHGKRGDTFTGDQLARMLKELGHQFKFS